MQNPIDPVNPFIQYPRILHYSMNKNQRKSNFQFMFMRKHLFLVFLMALVGVKGWGQAPDVHGTWSLFISGTCGSYLHYC